MARNLREKIRAIVNDAYDLRQESVVSLLEKLVKEELELREEERDVTYYDLTQIQSSAAHEFATMRMDPEMLGKLSGDQTMIRTLCIVNATVGLLRAKGLTCSLLRYKK